MEYSNDLIDEEENTKGTWFSDLYFLTWSIMYWYVLDFEDKIKKFINFRGSPKTL
jgi:hypothetical protein